MPELPEVESVRRSLLPHVVGRIVFDARLLRRDMLIAPGDPAGGFARQRASGNSAGGSARPRFRPRPVTPEDLLVGCEIVDVLRRGKQLAILASRPGAHAAAPDRALGVQLGMTGHLTLLRPKEEAPARHVHARWQLSGGSTVIFHDPRRFGSLRVFRAAADIARHWAALGPDALAISASDLHESLRGSKRAIKAALLDQGVLAGVGNIYADESLFLANVHPKRRAGLLSADDCERLAAAIRAVLGQAVAAGGSTLRDYKNANGEAGSFQTQHLVYGRSGCPCTVCGTRLASATIALRTTVWCPSCQAARPPRRK